MGLVPPFVHPGVRQAEIGAQVHHLQTFFEEPRHHFHGGLVGESGKNEIADPGDGFNLERLADEIGLPQERGEEFPERLPHVSVRGQRRDLNLGMSGKEADQFGAGVTRRPDYTHSFHHCPRGEIQKRFLALKVSLDYL
jgi:hypothetical protein